MSTLYRHFCKYNGNLNQAIEATVNQLVLDGEFQTCYNETRQIRDKLVTLHPLTCNELKHDKYVLEFELEEEFQNKCNELFYLFVKKTGLNRIKSTTLDYYDKYENELIKILCLAL